MIRRFLCCLLVIVSVASLVGGPVVAQSGPVPAGPSGPTPTPDAPTTPTEPSTPPTGTPTPMPAGTPSPSSNDTGGNASGICGGMGLGARQVCNGAVNAVSGLASAAGEFYGEVMAGLIEFIVNRPRAMRNGEPAITGEPTNAPMDSIRDVWATTAMPVAFSLWALFMLLNEFRGLAPAGKRSSYSKSEMHVRGWITLGFIIGSWQIGQVLLHLAHAMAMAFAPDPSMLGADLQIAQGSGAAAIISAVLIYFLGGGLALLAAIEFIAAYLGVFIIVPYLPVIMALTMPDFWIFDRLQAVGESLMAMVIPTIFFTVPTAAVLSVGYTVSNALATATPDLLSFIPGVAIGVGVVMGVLQLITWVVAIIAPLGMWLMSSQSKAAAGALAGAASVASLGMLSRSGSSAASGSAASSSSPSALAAGSSSESATPMPSGTPGTDPVAGASLSADSAKGSTGVPAPSGVGAPAPNETPSPSGPPSPSITDRPVVSGADAYHDSGSSSSTSSGSASSAGAATNGSNSSSGTSGTPVTESVTQVHDRMEFDADRPYEVGHMTADGFDRQVPHPMGGEALVDDGRFQKLAESEHFGDRDLVLHDPDDDSLYDVNEIAQRDRDYDRVSDVSEQNRSSRSTVYDTGDF